LSEALGEEVFRASGLGGPDDAEQLRRQVGDLEQTVADVRQQLTERTEELDAARMANRELMATLNRPTPSRLSPRRRQ
jgi:regulator of replication initiation timing